MAVRFRRYCKTLTLEDDPELIKAYKEVHAPGNAWPEITEGMKSVGILDMEIYLSGTTLFMIMDTEENFDHDAAMTKLAGLPRQAEWEAYVSRFQETSENASAKDKWRLMERIYKMDGSSSNAPEDGYEEKIG
ncbi:L-rhamnose mutarotase [bacterium]|nr:L-rhamnose mutarotase [bacterium]